MSVKTESDSSTSESEVSEFSDSNYKPLKTLYSDKVKIAVEEAPLYENIAQFEAAQKKENEIIPFGNAELVAKREEEKEKKRLEEEKRLEEKNKQRFAQYAAMVPTRKEFKVKNVLTRMETMDGPLELLKEYVDKRLRVKIVTRNDREVRGYLQATIVAFDKHWNMALTDVLEVWKRKKLKNRKGIPGLGTPVPKGTAATISPVPLVTEAPVSKNISECKRHIPQMMVRGEHVVLVCLIR